ncbi:hypothetical protein KDK95_00015 [Actinospica sp. MGRD01-02]|uniref:Uncharacterized protein n=1 Tax=Actinospica acidithermotolerans TaxID=2828514 RepID=A0A941E223_9ACTN|nr:hypothetical protein [Actinospica acidithermotolerans]MBR7824675.1 hypothetical protein [Actinospica acidithermotolerans]
MTESHGTDVLIDVTSLISAEDYLVSQNRHARPGDPFAQQCFVEIIQSLIFMTHVYVSHPLLHNPEPADFGQRPLLLQSLMAAGLLSPLQLDSKKQSSARALERRAIADLQGANGIKSMARFVDQAFSIDQSTVGRQNGLSERLRAWGAFQHSEVKIATGHHRERIPTQDGVEDDEFGRWARAAALLLAGALDTIAEPGDGPYVMATLARGMKYRARAEACHVAYQSHPLRRDFSLTFDLTRRGATDAAVLDLIRAVRGIHDSLADAAGVEETHRLRLLQLELPLLGGRLWTAQETGTIPDPDWIELVVSRVREYRDRAAELRQAIIDCITDEDQIRFARDIEGVTRHLLERLGLRRVELSPLEQELVSSVASVAQAAPGVPKVSGLWVSARTIGKQRTFTGAQPYQRFLYREFLDAWKRAGR